MPRNIEDIIPSGKKSIRNIPIPERRAAKVLREEPVAAVAPAAESIPTEFPRVRHARVRSSKRGLFAGIIGGMLLIALAILALQDGATLTYTPKVAALTFSGDTLDAYQAPEEGALAYSLIKLTSEKSVNVPATGEENVSVPAEGRVVIYNEQSKAQALVKTTRLESPEGKIYRIQEDVTIPAKGSLELIAVADQPGPAYNLPLSDFTIPGFKGSTKFELVYARSKTPMSGGFSGTRKKVSDSDLAGAREKLEETVRSELLTQAEAQMPADYILFPDLADIQYEIMPVENAGESSAKITLRGHLSAAIFKESDFAEHLAALKLDGDNADRQFELSDLSSLEVKLAEEMSPDSVSLSINGTAAIRYATDETALAAELAGTSKEGLDAVLERYPSIANASAALLPFWKKSFPEDASKIKIVENN